jgi:hypothetical protein
VARRGGGGARHPSWLPLEMTSLAPAEAPWWCSLQGWRLLCSGKEEVAMTKVTTMAATTVAGMLSSWWLQEQELDGAMRASRGRRGRGDNGSGSVVAQGVGGG